MILDNTDSLSEIRCPYCCSYISITQNKLDKLKLTLYCENCGKKDISLESFHFLIKANNTKICNFCCKNFEIKELLHSKLGKNFLCKKCYTPLLNQQLIKNNDFIPFTEIGKYCKQHNNCINSYFCEFCERHLCSECLISHQHHSFQNVKNLSEEAKKKYDIESLKLMIKQEENEIEDEEIFGQMLINSMAEIFEKEAKNREELLYFKKIIYLYLISNCDNYETLKNMENLFNKEIDPDFFINETELNELEKLLNDIDPNFKINHNIKNNSKKNEKDINSKQNSKNNNKKDLRDDESSKRHSISEIKQSKRNSHNVPKASDMNKSKVSDKRNNNKTKNNSKPKFNLDRKKNLYALVTPIKSQRFKNKKYIEKSNDMINNAIQNNAPRFFYSSMNIKLPQENKNNESLSIIQDLKFSIISMIYLGSNKLLISVFSSDKNLFLTEIVKNYEKGNNTINMNILLSEKIGNKAIIYMEILESGNIISCTDDKIFIFKIINNKILIKNIFANNNIIACVPLEKDNFLVLQSITKEKMNDIYFYSHGNNNLTFGYKKNIIPISKEFQVIAMEKLANDTCALIMQKINYININQNMIYLIIMSLKSNRFLLSKIKELICIDKEKIEKIFIKKLFNKYLIISESINSFIIYDFQNDIINSKIQCENVISTYIKNIDNEQTHLYTIMKGKDVDEKIMEEIKIKKYWIRKSNKEIIKGNNINNKKGIEINALTSTKLSGYNKNNKINDMIVITDDNRDEKDKNGSDKNLVLLADNAGNIFYKYY